MQSKIEMPMKKFKNNKFGEWEILEARRINEQV